MQQSQSNDQTKDIRKHRHLRVPVLQEEAESIKAAAASAGLSVAAYLRNIGLGYRITGVVDNKRVEELAKINGDLGRLGGLLKLWLTDDNKTRHVGPTAIRAVLSKIEDSQAEMLQIMETVVMRNGH